MTYKCIAKGGKNFRNTEFFSFDGDRIKRIDVYFGASYENGAFVRQPQMYRSVSIRRGLFVITELFECPFNAALPSAGIVLPQGADRAV